MDFIQRYRELRLAGHGCDVALGVIRSEGAGFIQRMKALHDVDALTVAEAKATVHQSPAWADNRADREEFWDEVIAILQAETRA
jgi:hypothetical protein